MRPQVNGKRPVKKKERFQKDLDEIWTLGGMSSAIHDGGESGRTGTKVSASTKRARADTKPPTAQPPRGRRELVVAVVVVRICFALLFAWLAGGVSRLVWARAWHMQPATGGIVPFVGESLLL